MAVAGVGEGGATVAVFDGGCGEGGEGGCCGVRGAAGRSVSYGFLFVM
jgi:hypothetical protein